MDGWMDGLDDDEMAFNRGSSSGSSRRFTLFSRSCIYAWRGLTHLALDEREGPVLERPARVALRVDVRHLLQ